jgi:uncharacterized protein YkwD
MNKNLLFISLNLLYFQDEAQFKIDLSSWDATTINSARKASYNPLCSKKSSEVVFICNLARVDGKRFVETILSPYMEFTEDTAYSEYMQSLIVQLNNQGKLPLLKHCLHLEMMAKSYAKRAGKNGIVGHDKIAERFSLFRILGKPYGENCSYGEETPIGVVIQLLVDEGIKNLGHRRNILSPDFKRIGVGFAKHSNYDINCVQEFSD